MKKIGPESFREGYVDDYGMRGIKQTKDMTAFGNSEDYPNPYGVLFI